MIPKLDSFFRVGFVGVVVALGAGCESSVEVERTEIRPVRYAEVLPQGGLEERLYSGSARAELETDLSFKVSGNLVSRSADIGDTIAAGELVARLDDTDYRVQVQEAEAGLARAQAELRNAEASYERTRELYENRSASRSELDAARAGAESARAQVRASQQQLEATRLQLSYTRLSAPQDCSVAQVLAEVNQNVAAGQSVIRVNCGQCAEVVVSVPETEIRRVNQGTTVQVVIDAISGEPLVGVVSEVGVASGAGTTYPVTVALQEGCGSVRSGMAADVRFRFVNPGSQGALVVPFVAVGEDSEGRFVYVLEAASAEDGTWTATRRSVQVGGPASAGLVIADGLAAGERIATAGVRRLVDGQIVTLLGAESSARP